MGQGDADLSSSAGLLAKAEQFRKAGDLRTATALALKGNELKKQEAAAASQVKKDDLAERRFQEAELVKNADKKQFEADKLEQALTIAREKIASEEKQGISNNENKMAMKRLESMWHMAAAEARKAAAAAGGESKQPLIYNDDKGNAVWGTIAEARGKAAAIYDPNTRALVSGAQTGGKTGVELSAKDYGVARGAVAAIPKVDALIAQLEKGDVITGSAADLRTGFAKVTALLGGKDAAKTASDTEIAEAMMGSEVFPLIQSLGIGAKGMDTPAEREFIRSVLTGSKGMEKETLLQLARMRKNELTKGISRFDTELDSGRHDLFFKSTGIPKTKLGTTKPIQANRIKFDSNGNMVK